MLPRYARIGKQHFLFKHWKQVSLIVCCCQLVSFVLFALLTHTSLFSCNPDHPLHLSDFLPRIYSNKQDSLINYLHSSNPRQSILALYPFPGHDHDKNAGKPVKKHKKHIPIDALTLGLNGDKNNPNHNDDNNGQQLISTTESPLVNQKQDVIDSLVKLDQSLNNIYPQDYGEDNLIFIALASYRDDECSKTILNAFETARYPSRLRFGVFQQHNITDGDCFDFYKYIHCDALKTQSEMIENDIKDLNQVSSNNINNNDDKNKDEEIVGKNVKNKENKDNVENVGNSNEYIKDYDNNVAIHPICGRMWQIKIDRMDYEHAKGPMYGRYRAELFYDNEEFMLQIDAHTRFVPNWDNVLIDMWYRTINNRRRNGIISDKIVLTTYPKATKEKEIGWVPPIAEKTAPVVAVCQTKINPWSFMFKHQRGHFVNNPRKPVLAPFFAAGFAFSGGGRVIEVPTDPYLPYLFDGEEILMTTRLWTNGYDLYMPDRDIVYHIYEEYHKRPLFWKDDWNKEKKSYEKRAQRRVNYILGLWDKCCKSITKDNKKIDLRNITQNNNIYGLGIERDISDFWKWIEFDWDKLGSTNKNCDNNDNACLSKDFCRTLESGKMTRIPTKSEISKKTSVKR